MVALLLPGEVCRLASRRVAPPDGGQLLNASSPSGPDTLVEVACSVMSMSVYPRPPLDDPATLQPLPSA